MKPHQAMQLTASSPRRIRPLADNPAVYGWSACRRERMLRLMHRGLAAAVDVFASPLSHRYPVRLYRLPGGFPARRVLVSR